VIRYIVAALLVSAPAFLAPAPALAQNKNQGTPAPDTLDPAKTYALCLDTARLFPEQGIEFAGKWVGLGGGEPAKHCQAVAMMGLREYGEAATRLEELAEKSKRSADVRVGMLAQAAQSWLLLGDTQRAHAAQTAALKLKPKDAKLLVDRSLTLAEAKNYWEAIDDLNAAIEIDNKNAEAYAFRASAYRMVSEDELAMDDAERALMLDANNLSGLLERGILRRMKGDDAGARKDWLRILEIEPGSEPAKAARANIEKLDVNPEK
jgi:tetratricopeptide (TPR) repeat protein